MRSRSLLIAASVVLAIGAPSLAGAQARGELDVTLVLGEQTSIPATGVRNYSEGVPGVIDVRLTKDGSEFIVVALRPGKTTLLLIFQDGRKVQHAFSVVKSRDDEAAISVRENIRLDFYFVELSGSYGHQIGIGWPASLGGAGVFRASATIDLKTGTMPSATAVVANQPLPRLDLLQASGWASIKRRAALVTANGNEANFSSGGEVNLAIQGALTAEIRRIDFGSTIKVLPRYDKASGRIELKVQADVSDLTDGSGSGIPGRTVSHLETLVNLELGQGVMLAGLDDSSRAYSEAGLPWLSKIPVLGYLFGSRTLREQERQTVLFIVPTVVDLVSMKARDQIGEALELYGEFDGDLSDIELIGEPTASPAGAGGVTPAAAPPKRRPPR